jgi:hypothetical protein
MSERLGRDSRAAHLGRSSNEIDVVRSFFGGGELLVARRSCVSSIPPAIQLRWRK